LIKCIFAENFGFTLYITDLGYVLGLGLDLGVCLLDSFNDNACLPYLFTCSCTACPVFYTVGVLACVVIYIVARQRGVRARRAVRERALLERKRAQRTGTESHEMF